MHVPYPGIPAFSIAFKNNYYYTVPGSDFYCCHSLLRHDSLIYAFLMIKWFLAYSEIRLGVTKESASQHSILYVVLHLKIFWSPKYWHSWLILTHRNGNVNPPLVE